MPPGGSSVCVSVLHRLGCALGKLTAFALGPLVDGAFAQRSGVRFDRQPNLGCGELNLLKCADLLEAIQVPEAHGIDQGASLIAALRRHGERDELASQQGAGIATGRPVGPLHLGQPTVGRFVVVVLNAAAVHEVVVDAPAYSIALVRRGCVVEHRPKPRRRANRWIDHRSIGYALHRTDRWLFLRLIDEVRELAAHACRVIGADARNEVTRTRLPLNASWHCQAGSSGSAGLTSLGGGGRRRLAGREHLRRWAAVPLALDAGARAPMSLPSSLFIGRR